MKISTAARKQNNFSSIGSTSAINLTRQYNLVKEKSTTDASAGYVKLANNQIIMATAERVWVNRPDTVNQHDFLVQLPPENLRSIAITKKLLDTAILLGKQAAYDCQQSPQLNKTNWVWSLIGQYHLTHPTPQLMRQAARRFKLQSRHQLAEWATEKALEETGHDRLALRDLQSLGYEAEALVRAFMPSSAKILVDYFVRSVENSDPIASVGYSYTLERVALAIQESHIQAIEAILPSGINATRCLRVHSSIGSDVEHVAETLDMIAKLTLAERNSIASACFETAKRYFTIRENDYPPVEKLQQMLQPFKG